MLACQALIPPGVLSSSHHSGSASWMKISLPDLCLRSASLSRIRQNTEAVFPSSASSIPMVYLLLGIDTFDDWLGSIR